MKPFTDRIITDLTRWLETEREFVFLETSRVTKDDYQSYLFTKPHQWLTCTDTDQAAAYLQKLDAWQKKGFFLAGWISYEFGYLLEPSLAELLRQNKNNTNSRQPLAVMGVFSQPLIYNHKEGHFDQETPWQDSPQDTPDTFKVDTITTNVTHQEYIDILKKIKNYILAGDTYQVNYTFKINFSHQGSQSGLYRALRKNQSVSYGAWIRHNSYDIMSFSPELFYRADHHRLKVRPMKGTIVRGRTLDEDAAQKSKLQNDEKNISENVMIVDLLRNDLAKLLFTTCSGTVTADSLFDIEAYETLLQMTSTITGTPANKKPIDLSKTITALFPCGSVTGAPKIRTMEIIDETEKEYRGVYCGAIGFCGPETTVFNVPIRTLTLNNGNGSMGIGSGIVHDSDPEEEWRESLLKSNFLTGSKTDFQLIETLLWQPGTGYWLYDYHLKRLSDSAQYFLFSYQPQKLEDALKKESSSFQFRQNCFRVRILLYRDGKFEITVTPLDHPPFTDPLLPTINEPLPVIILSNVQVNNNNPFLFHKTTLRTLYNEERNRTTVNGIYEVIFQNTCGEITEGSISNIFIEKNNVLTTPPVASGLLAGTFRRYLLDNGLAHEMILSPNDLLTADNIYIGNSVRGLVKVRFIPEQCLSAATI